LWGSFSREDPEKEKNVGRSLNERREDARRFLEYHEKRKDRFSRASTDGPKVTKNFSRTKLGNSKKGGVGGGALKDIVKGNGVRNAFSSRKADIQNLTKREP